MGFFDSFSDSMNSRFDSIVRQYADKLRRASDTAVMKKWDYVCNDDSVDEKFREVTEKEMRRRGLL